MDSAIYEGSVTHVRVRPVRHRLRYPMLDLLIDLDEAPALGRTLAARGRGIVRPQGLERFLELARDPPDRRRLLLLDLVLEDVESRFRASHCLSLFERADDTPTPQGARA